MDADRGKILPSHEPGLRSRRCETAEIGAAGRIRQFTLVATRVQGPDARPKLEVEAPHEPRSSGRESAPSYPR